MFDNFLLPLKAQYELKFNNNIYPYIVSNPDFYIPYVEYVFTHLEEKLLTNSYVTIIAVMRDHADRYVSDMVSELYHEAIVEADSRLSDLDDGTFAVSLHDRQYAERHYDFLMENEMSITSNLYGIVYLLIINVFHVIHHLCVEASNVGIYFSLFRIASVQDRSALTIIGTPTLEVIKRYDESFYDRLCMLAPV